MRRWTSAGSDNGALPIRDLHLGELEKSLVGEGESKAGTSRSRSAIELLCGSLVRRLHLIAVVCMFGENSQD